jgi:hypothetical protein
VSAESARKSISNSGCVPTRMRNRPLPTPRETPWTKTLPRKAVRSIRQIGESKRKSRNQIDMEIIVSVIPKHISRMLPLTLLWLALWACFWLPSSVFGQTGPTMQRGVTILPQITLEGAVAAPDSDTSNPGASALGFDGTNHMVVSCRSIGTAQGIFGVEVSSTGTVLNNFLIARQSCPVQASIGFDGTNYLLVYAKAVLTGSEVPDIFGIRFSPSGKVLDGSIGFPISTTLPSGSAENFHPLIGFDGSNYLVVWNKFDDSTDYIYGTFVTPGGKALGEFQISSSSMPLGAGALGFDGVNFLLLYNSTPGADTEILATRVSLKGAILDPSGIPISTSPGNKDCCGVTFDGINYFAVWSDQRLGVAAGALDIFGARIKPDGTLLDGPPKTGGIPISASPAHPPVAKLSARAAFDGTNYFVTWDEIGGIFAARVNRSGMLLDSPASGGGVTITPAPCFASCLPIYPQVSFKGQSGFLTWTYNAETLGTTKEILASRIVSPGFFISSVPSPILVGDGFTLTGSGFTVGSVLNFFVATANGSINAGPLKPSAKTGNQLTVAVPSSVTQGEGFVALEAVNTDQKFAASNLFGALLQGSPKASLPSITGINGIPIAADSANLSVGLANVETVVPQGSVVRLAGAGFDVTHGIAVDVFCGCPGGKVGPFFLNPGNPALTASAISFNLPAAGVNAPATGPGSFRVSNKGADGSYSNKSNAVSAPIGPSPIGIGSVIQTGSLIVVNGDGFSAQTVINFFNDKAGNVVNLGGLDAKGNPKISLAVINDTQFTFSIPAGAVPGPAYVQALNPPFVPFTSTDGDLAGAFTLH